MQLQVVDFYFCNRIKPFETLIHRSDGADLRTLTWGRVHVLLSLFRAKALALHLSEFARLLYAEQCQAISKQQRMRYDFS